MIVCGLLYPGCNVHVLYYILILDLTTFVVFLHFSKYGCTSKKRKKKEQLMSWMFANFAWDAYYFRNNWRNIMIIQIWLFLKINFMLVRIQKIFNFSSQMLWNIERLHFMASCRMESDLLRTENMTWRSKINLESPENYD